MIAGVDPPALNPARLYCEGRITGFRGWRGGSSGTLMVTSLPERGSRNGRGILTSRGTQRPHSQSSFCHTYGSGAQQHEHRGHLLQDVQQIV